MESDENFIMSKNNNFTYAPKRITVNFYNKPKLIQDLMILKMISLIKYVVSLSIHQSQVLEDQVKLFWTKNRPVEKYHYNTQMV